MLLEGPQPAPVNPDGGEVHTIRTNSSPDPLIADISVSSKVIQFEVDTGCGVSVMRAAQFRSLFEDAVISHSNVALHAVSGPVPVVGQAVVSVNVLAECHELILILCSDDHVLEYPLLGREWLNVINPKWRECLLPLVEAVSAISSLKVPSVEVMSKLFPRPFLSKDDNSFIEHFYAKLILRIDFTPIKHGAYSIAFGLMKPVENVLNCWVKSSKAVRVRHAEWASPVVPVLKKDGTVRLCVDFKTTLNPQLRVDFYPLPKPDTIFAHLANGVYFTSLDLKDAYTQLRLDEDSQELCVMNTHKGYYKLTRLIYGVASAAAIFQSVMDEILIDLEGVVCYIDNILVQGKSLDECVRRTYAVLGRLDRFNVRLNASKCLFFVKELEFLGFVIKNGCRGQAPSITYAITHAKIPENAKEVSSFLGLLNFYAVFVPMISTVEKPLRLLTTSDSDFNWTEECQMAFDTCKKLIISSDVLMLFNPDLPIVIYTDASPVGVGAVLCHTVTHNGKPVDRPVMFASSSLTPAQANYSQLDREALAVMFAVSKFDRFVWGRQFTLVTDNYPIRRIFSSSRGLPQRTAERLQHWAAILMRYNYKVIHKKAEFLCVADTLSRLPTKRTIVENHHVKVLSDLPITADVVARETANDPVLSQVLQLARIGWPRKSAKLNPEIVPYFKICDNISIEKGCVLMSTRVIIPSKLRAQVLVMLHEGHPGIVRTKALARGLVWWPSLNADLETMIQNCVPCSAVNRPHKKLYISWPETSEPFQRVHLDFFQFRSSNFLIVVDAFTRWLDVVQMDSTNSPSVTAKLLNTFSTFGLPKAIVTDNGPPFDSDDFAEFCTKYDIQLLHSPVYNPESNGLAEKCVSIAKSALSKLLFNENVVPPNVNLQDLLCKFLFNYRNTPNSVNLKAPNELLFAFRPRTLLTNLLPGKRGLIRGHFSEGEKVFVKLTKKGPTVSAEIVRPLSENRYLISIEGVLKEVHHNKLVRSPVI